MELAKEDIRRAATLARLSVSDTQLVSQQRAVSAVLTLVASMQEVDTTDVAPMAHPFDAVQKLRADSCCENHSKEAFQAQAPESADGYYLVPRVIE